MWAVFTKPTSSCINSQSGKGGIGYLLEQNSGYKLPDAMREEVGYLMKRISDQGHKELAPGEVQDIFEKEYVNNFASIDITKASFKQVNGITATIWVTIDGKHFESTAMGNGRLDAVSNALKECDLDLDYAITTYTEHALEVGSDSRACSYVAITDKDGNLFWGVGIHSDIINSSVNALVSAINRKLKA